MRAIELALQVGGGALGGLLWGLGFRVWGLGVRVPPKP